MGESKLIEAQNGGYLDWYCFSVISNIWGNRNRLKCIEKSSTSPLFETSGSIESEFIDNYEHIPEIDYYPYVKESIRYIQEDINSNDIILNFRARVFAYSVGLKIEDGIVRLGGTIRSIREFSRTSKIPMSACHSAFTNYKETLINKLKI